MSEIKDLTDQLKSLVEELDEETLGSLPAEEIVKMRSQLNPYGRTIEGSGQVLTFSFVNMREKYMKRLLMVGMVGFLNRMCDEWGVPDGVNAVPVYEYLQDPTALDPTPDELARETDKQRRDRLSNAQWMEKRIVVKEFLESLFQFSPDEHVRSSYNPDPRNEEREMFDTLAGKLAVQHRCRTDPVFADRVRIYNEQQETLGRPKHDEGVVGNIGEHMALAFERLGKLEAELAKANEKKTAAKTEAETAAETAADEAKTPDEKTKLTEAEKAEEKQLAGVIADLRSRVELTKTEANRLLWQAKKSEDAEHRLAAAKHDLSTLEASGADTKEALAEVERLSALVVSGPPKDHDPTLVTIVREMIPPDDTFHRWSNYMDANYESMLSAVCDLYCEVPAFEAAINPYKMNESMEEADEFIHKHRDEVIADIHKGTTGKWNIISKYEKARESTRYFNDKTIVLEEIMAQVERDAKLGADLMKKRIEKKKRQNIQEDGPDDPMFTRWKKSNSTLKSMGAIEVNQPSYANDECPDDGIQVDVFNVSKGGRTLKKTKFYTQAEAPTFMEEKKD
jgi:hypothetical protein